MNPFIVFKLQLVYGFAKIEGIFLCAKATSSGVGCILPLPAGD
jgi:hypothetical protein